MKQQTSQTLYAHWSRLKGDEKAPFRAQIEPADLAGILPNVMLLQRQDLSRYEFRIAGTGLCTYFGRELRGEDFLALWSETEREGVDTLLANVTNDLAGAVIGLEARTDAGQVVNMEAMMLPLLMHPEKPAQIIGSLAPFGDPFWLGRAPITGLSIHSLRLLWADAAALAGAAPMPPGGGAQMPRETAQQHRSPKRRGHLLVIEGGGGK